MKEDRKKSLLCGLKPLRLAKNMSQDSLGRFLGVTARSVARYESHLRFPREDVIEAICVALECESWQLFHANPIQARQDLEEVAEATQGG